MVVVVVWSRGRCANSNVINVKRIDRLTNIGLMSRPQKREPQGRCPGTSARRNLDLRC